MTTTRRSLDELMTADLPDLFEALADSLSPTQPTNSAQRFAAALAAESRELAKLTRQLAAEQAAAERAEARRQAEVRATVTDAQRDRIAARRAARKAEGWYR